MPQPADQSPPRWSESPWLWFFAFAVMAIVALAVIGPKHVRRQQRLVRMQQTRERIAASQAAGRSHEAEAPASHAAETPQQPEVSVLPLMTFLLLLAAAVGAGLMITARRRASRAAAAEKHPP